MDYETYRKKNFTEPQPEPRFDFLGIHGATLFYKDYTAAISFYKQVFGPPNYKEGEFTHGWRLGNSWLTIFPSKTGSPENIEVPFYLPSRKAVDTLYHAFLAAGAKGDEPSEGLMYKPVYMTIVTDPFGVSLTLVCELA